MVYKITLNGRTYEVEVEEGKAMLLSEYEAIVPTAAPSAPAAPAAAPAAAASAEETPAAAPAVTGNGTPINAPMPGTILKVNVSVGQKVAKDTVLCILEAMKMENEILAPNDGTVTQVLVSNGSNVDTGAPLVVLA